MSSVYTVSQVNSYIRQLFSTDLLLGRIYIKGEISNCKYHSSGHVYFSLKDEGGQIRCVLFASHRRNLRFRLENGMRVIAYGQVNVYERDGTYQLYCTDMRPDGIGALYERFEALKKELSEMGMFAPEYKQKIPRYIRTLGVVTAPTGAAVRDIINVAKRRNPGIQIILYPALVQGENAAESIAEGISVLDRMGVDLIIAGRGGGSIEDLWAFNEELVARAAFNCLTPIISAVGHETDTTILDFVADLRAPTPSAAAELAVDDVMQTLAQLRQTGMRLTSLMTARSDLAGQKLVQYRLKLRMNGPEARIRDARQRLVYLQDRMEMLSAGRLKEASARAEDYSRRMDSLLEAKRKESKSRLELLESLMKRCMAERVRTEKHRLALALKGLESLSPLAKLERGFVYVQNADGNAVCSVRDLTEGSRIRLSLRDGEADAAVEEIRNSRAGQEAENGSG